MIYIFLLLILILLLFSYYKRIEHFEVGIKTKFNYGQDYFGFCRPNISEEQFASGLYQTRCWDKKSYEDCNLLNNNGFDCGVYLPTGETLACYHSKKVCHSTPICNNSCYESARNCDKSILTDINYKKQILSGSLL